MRLLPNLEEFIRGGLIIAGWEAIDAGLFAWKSKIRRLASRSGS